MKKRAMKKSVIAKGKRARAAVFKGTKAKTYTGLTKSNLKKNKYGKIVTVKASANAKKGKSYKWALALKAARASLKIKGFQAVGGKTAKGQALLKATRSFYKK